MTFYMKHPRGFANVKNLEDTVQQRLTFYDNIFSNNIQDVILNLDCLAEDTVFDRLGHYLFRLASLKISGFSNIFISNEVKLLHARLNCYSQADAKYVIRKLKKHAIECLASVEVEGKAKQFYSLLIKTSMQLLGKKFFDHAFKAHDEICAQCEEFRFKVDNCQNLWKSLRDRFTREKRDMGRSGSAALDSKWALFEKMFFYEKYIKPRQTYTSTTRPSSSTSTSSISVKLGTSEWSTVLSPEPSLESQLQVEDMTIDEDQNLTERHLGEPEGAQNPKTTPVSRVPLKPTPNLATPSSSKRGCKRKAQDPEAELLEVAKSLAISVKTQQSKKNDTNKTFVDYVYSELNEMPAEKSKQIRKRFLEILMEEED